MGCSSNLQDHQLRFTVINIIMMKRFEILWELLKNVTQRHEVNKCWKMVPTHLLNVGLPQPSIWKSMISEKCNKAKCNETRYAYNIYVCICIQSPGAESGTICGPQRKKNGLSCLIWRVMEIGSELPTQPSQDLSKLSFRTVKTPRKGGCCLFRARMTTLKGPGTGLATRGFLISQVPIFCSSQSVWHRLEQLKGWRRHPEVKALGLGLLADKTRAMLLPPWKGNREPGREDVLAAQVCLLPEPAQLVAGNLMKIISCKLLKNKQTTIQRFNNSPLSQMAAGALPGRKKKKKKRSPTLNFLFVLDPALFGCHWSPAPFVRQPPRVLCSGSLRQLSPD